MGWTLETNVTGRLCARAASPGPARGATARDAPSGRCRNRRHVEREPHGLQRPRPGGGKWRHDGRARRHRSSSSTSLVAACGSCRSAPSLQPRRGPRSRASCARAVVGRGSCGSTSPRRFGRRALRRARSPRKRLRLQLVPQHAVHALWFFTPASTMSALCSPSDAAPTDCAQRATTVSSSRPVPPCDPCSLPWLV